MGNAVQCMARNLAVRIVQPDGAIMEFDYLIEVSELMNLYPDHIVVHCSASSSSLGHRSKITIMEPGNLLVPGQSYILYPVPVQYKQNPQGLQFFSHSSGSSRSKGRMAVRRRNRSQRVKNFMQCLVHLLKGSPFVPAKQRAEGSSPLLKPGQKEESFTFANSTQTEQKKPKPALTLVPYSWTPSLDCIPESPLGYHDTPPSPFSFPQFNLPPSPRGPQPSSLSSNTAQLPYETTKGLGLGSEWKPFGPSSTSSQSAVPWSRL